MMQRIWIRCSKGVAWLLLSALSALFLPAAGLLATQASPTLIEEKYRLSAEPGTCSTTTRTVGSIVGSPVGSVEVYNNIAYIPVYDAQHIEMVDIQDPSIPNRLATIQGFGETIGFNGNLAFIATGANGLKIVDITNPISPTLLGTYKGQTPIDDGSIRGSYAYVVGVSAGGNSTLQILDVQDPTAPILRGSHPLPVNAYHVSVANNIAYISTHNSFVLIDISNPDIPALVSTIPAGSWTAAVQNDMAYLASVDDGLVVVDVHDPNTPVIRGSLTLPSGALDVQLQGNLALVGTRSSGILVVDVTTPSSLTILGSNSTIGEVQDLEIVGSSVYAATGALEIFQFSQPASFTRLGSYDPRIADAFGVRVIGTTAYVADGENGLRILDVANVSLPTPRASYDTFGRALGLEVRNTIAYLADGPAGLMMLDVSDPLHIAPRGVFDTPGYARSLALDGSYLYIADETSLQILLLHPMGNPTLVGSYDVPAWAVQIVSGRAYVVGDAELTILNVQDPTQPVEVGHYHIPDVAELNDLHIADNQVYVAGWTLPLVSTPSRSMFAIIDVSNPANPNLLSFIDTLYAAVDQTASVTMAGDWVLVGNIILDVSDPAHPIKRGTIQGSPNVRDIYVDGQNIYILGRGSMSIQQFVDLPCFYTWLPFVVN